ncbi:uncharacterized protein NPIL_252631 [Nephila pilipes]|uniref:HTH CENPB-type domain-containing protein n=1 Tax=Nephila pilipes TaxID=299642 RepID=A0A8X6JC93_NEPPI|nr:uncharacterized protein NPIL_252631 [Nephila pilipes]
MTNDDEKGLEIRKTLKKPKCEILDHALWVWFEQERREGTPLSGPIIQERALILYNEMGESDNKKFTASEGWLHRWKKRHGIRNACATMQCSDEPPSSPRTDVSTSGGPSDTPVSLHDGDTGIFPSVELDETLQDLMGAPEERSRPAATEELIVPEAFPSLLGNRPQEVRIKEEPKSESEDGPQIVSVSSIEPEAHGSRTENPEVSVSRTERQEVSVPRKERPEAPVFRKETPVFRKERIDVQGKKMSAALTEALVRFSEVQAKQTAATEKLAAAIESSSRRFAEEMSTTMKILATVAQSQTQLMGILIDKCNKCGKCQKLD